MTTLRMLAVLLVGTFGTASVSPGIALAGDEQAGYAVEHYKAVGIEGVQRSDFQTVKNIQWLQISNSSGNVLEGAFSTAAFCVGFKIIGYGTMDYELWLSYGGKPFVYHSEDPSGVYNADATDDSVLPPMTDDHVRDLVAAAGELVFHPSVTATPTIQAVVVFPLPTGGQEMHDAARKKACTVASVIVGAGAKTSAESAAMVKTMNPMMRGMVGGAVGLAVGAALMMSCK